MVAADRAGDVEARARNGRTKDMRAKQERAQQKQEISKSQVRVRVTYLMSGTYAVTAVTLVVWLLWKESYDLALGVFSGIASTTATITAFWFGSRGSKRAAAKTGAGAGGGAPPAPGA